MSKRDISPSDKQAYYLLKSVNKAIRDYRMIANGDRVAVAVSGGKDSLALLHLLRLRQRSVAGRYDIIAVYVIMAKPDRTCAEAEGQDSLAHHFQTIGQPYSFEFVQVQDQPSCFRCSHLRRQALLQAARRLGCNKLAMGHHADDAAETTLLNLIFHGQVETLQPSRTFFQGQFTLIRPLIYVPEKRIARLAQLGALPVTTACCPNSAASRREWVKGLIRTMEQEYPRVKINLFRAGLGRWPPGSREQPNREDDERLTEEDYE